MADRRTGPKSNPKLRLKPKIRARREEILWEEFPNVRGQLFRTFEWGVTVLASLQTANFFLQREMKVALKLPEEAPLPTRGFLIGFIIITIVSIIFCYLISLVGNRFRNIRQQLIESDFYKIDHVPLSKFARSSAFTVFLAFPAVNLVIRLMVVFKLI